MITVLDQNIVGVVLDIWNVVMTGAVWLHSPLIKTYLPVIAI